MFRTIYPIIGNQSDLPFYLTGVGISEPEYHVKRESGLVSHQFLYTESGTGVLTVSGATHIQNKGSIFYLAPGVPHEYRPEENDWTTHWFVFRGDDVTHTMEKLGFVKFLHKPEADLSLCSSVFDRLITAAEDPISGGERASQLIYEFILAARQAMLGQGTDKAGAGSVIGEAVKYMNKYYMQDITLERLAVLSGVSLQHFCRVFKAKMGMRPMEYLARKRVAEAKRLLNDTGKKIYDVSEAVGYEDQNYFGIIFKKYEGITPSEYRRSRGIHVS